MTIRPLTLLLSLLVSINGFYASSSDPPTQQEQQQPEDVLQLRRENVTIMAYNVNHLHYVFQVAFRPRNEGSRIAKLNDALRNFGKTPETARYGVPSVLVLTEVMSNQASAEVSRLVDAYPHQTPRLGNDCQDRGFNTMSGCKEILLNGGVRILSKFPMLSRDGLVFSNRMNGDQLVNKGAVRVQLRVPDSGLVFNVVGTHMQSTDSALQRVNMEEKRIRRLQIVEILDWLRRLKIPKEEAVFIAGDFNVEFESPEYRQFLDDLPLEIDYVKDDAVGGSFSAKMRGDATNWLTAYHLYGSNVSQTDETLDFIAVVTDHRRPVESTPMEVVPLKSSESWSWWRMKGEWIINGTVYYHSGYYRDLSDHYPVIQSFVLEAAATTTTAASHDDAALRPFR